MAKPQKRLDWHSETKFPTCLSAPYLTDSSLSLLLSRLCSLISEILVNSAESWCADFKWAKPDVSVWDFIISQTLLCGSWSSLILTLLANLTRDLPNCSSIAALTKGKTSSILSYGKLLETVSYLCLRNSAYSLSTWRPSLSLLTTTSHPWNWPISSS